MLALVRFGPGTNDVELRDVPEPSPGIGEVKIEVKAAGVCGTDLIGHPSLVPPVVLGHELAGVVVETGEGVKERKIGDRVTSETTAFVCGKCRFCLSGDLNLCVERRGIATRADGAFARYMVIREQSTHLLADGISFEAGALCEPLACAVHAVIEQGEVCPGETVLVLGPGPTGLLVTEVAKAVGAEVIIAGTSADSERLALAKRLGASHSLDVTRENLKEFVLSITDGYGADVVVECTGVPAAVPVALSCLRRRGRYVQVGIMHADVPLDFDDLFFSRELTLIGSRTSRPSSWRKALELLESGQVQLEPLITRVLPLASWEEGFRMVREKKAIKVILVP